MKQRLVRLKVLEKSMNGEQIAAKLIDALSTSLQIQRQNIVVTNEMGQR